MSKKFSLSLFLWDLWCTVSIVGIWPRFVEPNLLATTTLKLPVKNLSKELEGLKIVQFSDLHLHAGVSENFLNRLSQKINNLKPDILVFSGDILCYGKLKQPDRLKKFLNTLSAPYGCYTIFGNHDYAGLVSINTNGDYDKSDAEEKTIGEGFRLLFSSPVVLTRKVTEAARNIPEHQELKALWSETPFILLNNETRVVDVKGTKLNITGVGEYTFGRCLPEKAFEKHDKNYLTLVLTHNPDAITTLEKYPGDIILAGHTHGGQINLPWIWRKLTIMENPKLKRGLFHIKERKLYVNRGIGASLPFRWFAIPEILSLTLVNDET